MARNIAGDLRGWRLIMVENIKSCFPENIKEKPLAVIECFEEIPCNPCSTVCPFGAIYIGANINERPRIDWNLCSGCGICVYSCPGQAIKLVQKRDDCLIFKIPYEFLPHPKKGEIWHAVDRNGNVIGEARIENVISSRRQDRTLLVTVGVEADLLYTFAGIRRKDE